VLSATKRPSPAATRAYAERYAWQKVAERHREISHRALSGGRGGERTHERDSDDPLKVVYLDHVARMSGGEIALLRLLPHLKDVQQHVILAEEGPLVDELHRARISTEVMPFAARARDLRKGQVDGTGVPALAAAATTTYVLRLARRLRELRPDVVHSNSLKAGVYGSLAARLAGVPMVWHVRDRIEDDYLPHAAVVMVRQMTRKLPAAVVANSKSTMATLHAPADTQRIYRVLPDVLGDVPVRARTNHRALTYGVVGRLAPWKGQDLFLRAFARAFPSGQERAVIVGGALFGEDAYADQLPRLAEELGIAERVELRGHRDDVWSELARLDVLVHASITPEPFGQVILEGMAAHVPVIAADAGGPAEIIEHDVTGVLYRPGDVDALVDAMRSLRAAEARERLSAAAHVAAARFSPAVTAEELQRIYSSVAEHSLRRR
jgi:glycosyltransferase involved in cell wall biosynthesis